MTIAGRAIAVLLVGATTTAIAVAKRGAPDETALLRALGSGDHAALERAAIVSSAGALHRQLESDERQAMIAASLAAPLVADAPLLLEPLAIAANAPDRSIALGAARAGLRIMNETEPERFDELETSRSELGAALRRWHELARDQTRWADVRVIALEISRDIAEQLASRPAAPVLELLADPDPEVRVAAFQLLPSPLPTEHIRRVAEAIGGEPDRAVAVAAAASLCGGAARGDPGDPAAALGGDGLRAVADLVADASLEGAARLAAAGCLSGAADHQAVLTRLAATLDPVLRPAARALAKGRP